MGEEICDVCKENEAKNKCQECGKKLCEDCTREFTYEETHPGYRQKGHSFMGAMSQGVNKKILCLKCFEDVEIF